MGDKQLTIEHMQFKINTLSIDDLWQYIVDNIMLIFSVSDFTKYYSLLKNIQPVEENKCMPKIVYAWLAFLSGDHANAFKMIQKISETNLVSDEESSLFYSLKALLSGMLNTEDAFHYATLAIDVLDPKDKSIYMANALLTYGQIYSGTDQYLKAAEQFLASYELFDAIDLYFLASTAFVNMVLNLYKVGHYTQVINQCQTILLKESNLHEGTSLNWKVVHLPLGLCYYELGKFNLAVEHLIIAKDTIDTLGLVHMHGMVELYLFKSYFILNDDSGMEAIKNETIKNFSNMNYPIMNLLIIMFTLYSNNKHLDQHKGMIEKLETEYLNGYQDGYSVIFELLVYLRLKGTSDVIKTDKLMERFSHFKKCNNISMVQITSIQLTELYLLEDNRSQAHYFLQVAIDLYRVYGVYSNFYLLPLSCINQIKQLDKDLYNVIIKSEYYQTYSNTRGNSLLTEREKDIVELIATGKSNKEMSDELFISVGTIKWHLNNIFSKLYVKNRIQAVEKAKELHEI